MLIYLYPDPDSEDHSATVEMIEPTYLDAMAKALAQHPWAAVAKAANGKRMNRPQAEARLAYLRDRQRRANAARRSRDQAMRDLGLVRVRGNLGGVYWE